MNHVLKNFFIFSAFQLSRSFGTMSKRGTFVVFEGIDRCGKSTQSKMLNDYLATKGSSQLIRYPDRTSSIGQLINSYLQSSSNLSDEAIHLLFSANRWESMGSVQSKLMDGCTLVCDRYAFSGVAFTSAKGLDVNWCKATDVGLIAPDCVIYLDMPVEDAAQRGSFGEERYERVDFQLKVRERFMTLKDLDTARTPWHVIDARKSIEEIHQEIVRIVEDVKAKNEDKPLRKLWVD